MRRDARRRGAELDVDPFAVLGLDAAALAAMDPRSRDAAVRAAYRAAALASLGDADCGLLADFRELGEKTLPGAFLFYLFRMGN